MFEESVLGVDPGLAATGVAVLCRERARPTVVWAGTIETPPALAESARLRRLHERVEAVLAEHAVGCLALEQVMWGRNVGSAMKVARATGVVMLAAEEAGVPIEEYAPLEVKMAVTGVGNASKAQLRTALERVHLVDGIPADPNAADAVAVALCHLQQSRMRSVARS
jgi:crossover junction endodeoxyribonuclease RuvC